MTIKTFKIDMNKSAEEKISDYSKRMYTENKVEFGKNKVPPPSKLSIKYEAK